MTTFGWTIATPAAPWSVIVDDEGRLLASGFVSLETLKSFRPSIPAPEVIAPQGPIAAAMTAYLDGDVNAIDPVDAEQAGGAFFQRAWKAMREIPPGRTWSYAELATKAGEPGAVRAAGSACARNLLAPFVPCHRVVRSDGSLGGYAYGADVKRWLLEHEGSQAGRLPLG